MSGGHDLDLSQIDCLDEIDGDEQSALVWCNTHQRWEWHWIDREALGTKRRKKVRGK